MDKTPIIYTIHLPDKSRHLRIAFKLDEFLKSDRALQYQDCQIRITIERNIEK